MRNEEQKNKRAYTPVEISVVREERDVIATSGGDTDFPFNDLINNIPPAGSN